MNPLDRTDQRLIRLVSQYGDPLVETQTLAEEVSLSFQETRSRLGTLAEQGWIDDQPGDGQRQWQVTSKASLLVRTDSEPPTPEEDDADIIDAEEREDAADGEDQEEGEEEEEEEEDATAADDADGTGSDAADSGADG